MYLNGQYYGYIYKITCINNNKVYIGQTRQTIKRRIIEHLSDTRLKKDNSILHKSIRKYGWENFRVERIQTIKNDNENELIDELNKYEIFYINIYKSTSRDNGYNIDLGGKSNNSLKKKIVVYNLSGEYIETLNDKYVAAEKYHISPKSINNCCNGSSMIPPNCNVIFRYVGDSVDKYDFKSVYKKNKTYKFSLEGKLLGEYVNTAEAGRSLKPNESKNKYAGGCITARFLKYNDKCVLYGYYWSKVCYFDKKFVDNYFNHVCIDEYDLDGNLINSFKSVADAGKSANGHRSSYTSIIRSCRGINKYPVYGSIWRFRGDDFDKYEVIPLRNSEKTIVQYTPDGKYVARYDNYKIAIIKNNYPKGTEKTIVNCCNGKFKYAKGFIWRWENSVQQDKS